MVIHKFASALTAGFLIAASGTVVLAEGPVNPADFVTKIDNPWLPLQPGTVRNYQGIKDATPSILTASVTTKTKTIAGVACVVVEELLTMAGTPTDRTIGYYAQDKTGNVWYFGEDVQELGAQGKVVKVEGWHAGIDGAMPGIVMSAQPETGMELVQTATDDHSAVVSLAKPVKVPMGSYPDALLVKEWTPHEPNVLINKYYVKGIGLVRDVSVKGDSEEFQLVAITK